jgi:hypothetical protein
VIIFELKAIGINVLFGIFFFIIINTFSLYESKIKSKIIINIFYFVLTIVAGILYIIYLDLILFSFNFYFPFFIILGFYIAYNIKLFKTEKYTPTINYLVKLIINIIKKVFLFLINYKFWKKLKQIIKKKE